MEKETPKNKYHFVRGIVVFLAILLFIPSVKDALNIKLITTADGYIGLWQLFVIIDIGLLLPALIFDRSDKIDIPFLKKFIKDD